VGEMKNYRFTVIVERDEDGYFVYCPELQGCYTQGDTFEEAMANIRDAIKLHVEDRLASNEPITTSEVISFSSLEVAV
jgi:predicted RNase H-like HicB family nuclease